MMTGVEHRAVIKWKVSTFDWMFVLCMFCLKTFQECLCSDGLKADMNRKKMLLAVKDWKLTWTEKQSYGKYKLVCIWYVLCMLLCFRCTCSQRRKWFKKRNIVVMWIERSNRVSVTIVVVWFVPCVFCYVSDCTCRDGFLLGVNRRDTSKNDCNCWTTIQQKLGKF